jgi:hypothetical protein
MCQIVCLDGTAGHRKIENAVRESHAELHVWGNRYLRVGEDPSESPSCSMCELAGTTDYTCARPGRKIEKDSMTRPADR